MVVHAIDVRLLTSHVYTLKWRLSTSPAADDAGQEGWLSYGEQNRALGSRLHVLPGEMVCDPNCYSCHRSR